LPLRRVNPNHWKNLGVRKPNAFGHSKENSNVREGSFAGCAGMLAQTRLACELKAMGGPASLDGEHDAQWNMPRHLAATV
jgi:hypothetical protein